MHRWRVAPPLSVTAMLLIMTVATGCATPVPPALNMESEPTAEGLYEVTGIDADEALARADSDMAQYTKILIRRIDVEFRPGGDVVGPQIARTSAGPYAISEQDQEEYRTYAEVEIREELGESKRFTLVEEPGADVLAVTIQLSDLASYVPPNQQYGRTSAYLNRLGEATIDLELRDSVTDAVIARASDRHTAGNISNVIQVTATATVTADVERLFRLFGRHMRQQLEGFAALGE